MVKRKRGKLILSDGSKYEGHLIGSGVFPAGGEVVFNTSMTGYQEVLTDPSYAGQIIVMTFPHIGNYGITHGDSEHPRIAARGLVVKELSEFFSPMSGRCSLEDFMKKSLVPGITGIDTRALTRKIRSQGVMGGAIGKIEQPDEDLISLAKRKGRIFGDELVGEVTGVLCGSSEEDARVAVIDLGIKKSIVAHLRSFDMGVRIFRADFSSRDILSDSFSMLVISNGPGDPSHLPKVIGNVEKLISNIPIMGICLGHQVTALALGGRTYKMKYGHRGSYQPVSCIRTGRIYITSQNHGYAVSDDISSCDGIEVSFVNTNDGTLEGFACEELGIHCVQFHPEASPGPHDTSFIFKDFVHEALKWHGRTITGSLKGSNVKSA